MNGVHGFFIPDCTKFTKENITKIKSGNYPTLGMSDFFSPYTICINEGKTQKPLPCNMSQCMFACHAIPCAKEQQCVDGLDFSFESVACNMTCYALYGKNCCYTMRLTNDFVKEHSQETMLSTIVNNPSVPQQNSIINFVEKMDSSISFLSQYKKAKYQCEMLTLYYDDPFIRFLASQVTFDSSKVSCDDIRYIYEKYQQGFLPGNFWHFADSCKHEDNAQTVEE